MLSTIWRRVSLNLTQNATALYFRARKLRTVGIRGSHSCPENLRMTSMDIKILPALEDNYMYLIIDNATREAAVVDPVEPATVIKALQEENAQLTKILTTHHHWDHSGGNSGLQAYFPHAIIPVYGGDTRIEGLTNPINDGDKFPIGQLNVTSLYTPCHTKGHMCYFVESQNGERAVFTGDTLFQGGCGRFFEGTAADMYTSLCQKLSLLPDDTKVFCGHEYTLPNLYFASHVEPGNQFIVQRIEWAKLRRAMNSPTIPSTIGEEKMYNPFMRVEVPTVQQHAGTSDPIQAMAVIRTEKDNFRT